MPPPRPAHRRRPKGARLRRRTARKNELPSVAVVGFGRVGGALALGLQRAGWPVTVLPRSGESVRRAVGLGLRLADHDSLHQADVCILAVPDQIVGHLAQTLMFDVGAQTAFVHCAGALDLSVFGSEPSMQRRNRGSFHPLCAVSDPSDELAGHSVAISASAKSFLPFLRQLAEVLQLTPIEVPEARRAAYHAGAVLCAGGLTSLASAGVAALQEAGISEEQALAALLPLMRSALRGIEKRGLARGMTGPVARGDLTVVQQHLDALPAELSKLYRLLSLRALTLVQGQLPPETRIAIEKVLS